MQVDSVERRRQKWDFQIGSKRDSAVIYRASLGLTLHLYSLLHDAFVHNHAATWGCVHY